MNTNIGWTIFLGLLPFVVYGAVKAWTKNDSKAIGVAILVAIGACFYEYFIEGRWNVLTIGDVILLTVMGGAAVIARNPMWFRMQPVVLSGLIGISIASLQLLTRGIAGYLIPELAPAAPEQYRPLLESPAFEHYFNFLISSSVIAFAIYAAVSYRAAKRWSDGAWLMNRMFGLYPIYFVVCLAAVLVYSLFGGNPQLQ